MRSQEEGQGEFPIPFLDLQVLIFIPEPFYNF